MLNSNWKKNFLTNLINKLKNEQPSRTFSDGSISFNFQDNNKNIFSNGINELKIPNATIKQIEFFGDLLVILVANPTFSQNGFLIYKTINNENFNFDFQLINSFDSFSSTDGKEQILEGIKEFKIDRNGYIFFFNWIKTSFVILNDVLSQPSSKDVFSILNLDVFLKEDGTTLKDKFWRSDDETTRKVYLSQDKNENNIYYFYLNYKVSTIKRQAAIFRIDYKGQKSTLLYEDYFKNLTQPNDFQNVEKIQFISSTTSNKVKILGVAIGNSAYTNQEVKVVQRETTAYTPFEVKKIILGIKNNPNVKNVKLEARGTNGWVTISNVNDLRENLSTSSRCQPASTSFYPTSTAFTYARVILYDGKTIVNQTPEKVKTRVTQGTNCLYYPNWKRSEFPDKLWTFRWEYVEDVLKPRNSISITLINEYNLENDKVNAIWQTQFDSAQQFYDVCSDEENQIATSFINAAGEKTIGRYDFEKNSLGYAWTSMLGSINILPIRNYNLFSNKNDVLFYSQDNDNFCVGFLYIPENFQENFVFQIFKSKDVNLDLFFTNKIENNNLFFALNSKQNSNFLISSYQYNNGSLRNSTPYFYEPYESKDEFNNFQRLQATNNNFIVYDETIKAKTASRNLTIFSFDINKYSLNNSPNIKSINWNIKDNTNLEVFNFNQKINKDRNKNIKFNINVNTAAQDLTNTNLVVEKVNAGIQLNQFISDNSDFQVLFLELYENENLRSKLDLQNLDLLQLSEDDSVAQLQVSLENRSFNLINKAKILNEKNEELATFDLNLRKDELLNLSVDFDLNYKEN